MPLLRRKRVLAAKVETTPGTAETLTASEGAFNAYDIDIQGTIDVAEREAQGSFNYLPGIPGARSGKITFKTDAWWDGTATEPSWATVLLPGCGWVLSTNTLYPTSEAPGSNVKTLTIGVFENGLYKKLAGAMGTFRVICPAGQAVYLEWEFTGVWQAVTDTAIIAPTYPTDTVLRYAAATSQWNSVNLCVNQVTFDAGNVVVLKECAGTAAGFDYALVTSRKPMINANPESALVATLDVYGAWLAQTEAEFTITLDGPGAATLELEAPKAQIVNVQENDRNGLQVDDITWCCNRNGATADQEFAFKFTP